MSGPYRVTLTKGHLLRHAPAHSTQGQDAALIDVAQDLLLRHLHDSGLLNLVAFKGGTALRKAYAGASGRFSTDLDFSIANHQDDPTTVAELIAETIEGAEVGPFRYGIAERRGRKHITYESALGTAGSSGNLQSKLDIGPPPWLAPIRRPWASLPIHALYDGPLPELFLVCLEENMAEKIARLNRRTPARDVYDLVWLAQQPGLHFDSVLVRRLAVLKCWVDQHGLTSTNSTWSTVPGARSFDPRR
jgi:predicted nucleotidyltransferase component of viral defense system